MKSCWQSFIITVALTFSILFASPPAQAVTINVSDTEVVATSMTAASTKISSSVRKKWKKTTKKLLVKLRKAKVHTDPKTLVNPNSTGVVRAERYVTSGTYSYRPGVILVTADWYKDLVPTGHAALVYDEYYVVEALAAGVSLGANDWYSSKHSAFEATVKTTTAEQDLSASDWSYARLGVPYNYNYFDIKTRKKFYCSQLVWADFLDNYGVNLNSSAYAISGLGNPVHPLELAASPKVTLIYKHYPA